MYFQKFAEDVFVAERETHSQLLGPDGKPLRYAPPQPIGFDLRPKSEREGQE
jgi:hypothetical protein